MKNSYQHTAAGKIYRVGYDWLFDNAARKEIPKSMLEGGEYKIRMSLFVGYKPDWPTLQSTYPNLSDNVSFIDKSFPLVPIKNKEQMARHYLFGQHKKMAKHRDLRHLEDIEVVVDEAAVYLSAEFGVPTHYILHDGFAVFFDIKLMEFLYTVDTADMVVIGSLICRDPSKLLFCKASKNLESKYEKNSSTHGENNKD